MDGLSVFISYARRDGRDLALRLRDDLLQVGHTPWLDTAEIEGGASWSKAIEDAIEQCQVMLVLLTQGAFVSEICRAEQLRGLRKEKRLIPLLVQQTAERPLHLESLNYRDFSDPVRYQDAFQQLQDDILTSESAVVPETYRTTIVSAPALPPHFIARTEELERLRSIVIGDNTDQQIALTALRGMGGIGKSVLATALCHDEVIQAAFPDGVVWVTIGREPGNLTEQMKLIGTRLGDAPGHYTSEALAVDRLRTLLAHKTALIVLDDVWDARHVAPFRFEAKRCRTLFTTRDGAIALAVGASEVRLGTLNSAQSVALLEEWSGRNDAEMKIIAERLGYLPLALKLAGARLREGMSVQEWLATFQHVSQMKLGRRSVDPHENLEICFDISVQQLVTEDQLLYHTFGAFPEDVAIPQATVTRLWRSLEPALSEYDANELVMDLARLALIDRDSHEQTITLHDLLHDYTRVKLGTRLKQIHQSLLEAYNPSGIPWYQVPHDGYLYFQLGYHLFGCEKRQEFIDLLLQTSDWLEAKFIACQGDIAYVADLDFALRSFSDPLSPADALIVTQLYIVRQIINVRNSVYIDQDLATLVWLGRKAEAVNHARLRVETLQRFDGLFAIYTAVLEMGEQDASLRDEMLRTAGETQSGYPRRIRLTDCARLLRKFNDEKHVEVFRNALADSSDVSATLWVYNLGLTLRTVDHVMSASCFLLAENLYPPNHDFFQRDEYYEIKTKIEHEGSYQYLVHMLLQRRRYTELIELVGHIWGDTSFHDFIDSLSGYREAGDTLPDPLPIRSKDALTVKFAALRAIDATFEAISRFGHSLDVVSRVAKVWLALGEYDALSKLFNQYFPWNAFRGSFFPRLSEADRSNAQALIDTVFMHLCQEGQALHALRIVATSASVLPQSEVEKLDEKIIDTLFALGKIDEAHTIVLTIPEVVVERKRYLSPVKIIIEAEKYVHFGEPERARQLLELAASTAQDRQLLDIALQIFHDQLDVEQSQLDRVLSMHIEAVEQPVISREPFHDNPFEDDLDDDLYFEPLSVGDHLVKLGVVALRLEHKRHARAWFVQSIMRDPQSSRAWHWLALVVENRSTQKLCLQNASKRAPNDINLIKWLQSLDFLDSLPKTKTDSSYDTLH